MNAEDRSKLIRERPKKSLFWKWVHLLGSLKTAVLLILSIALACAVATVYESRFNTAVAQYYIYKNPLFIFWLFFLCLNLICSAMTRWPWEKKHAGFVITHAGIILLLVGAVIGSTLGWEASVTLDKGAEPTGLLLRNETILMFQGSQSGEVYTTPLEVKVRQPRPDSPRIFPVPESDLQLRVSDYSEKLTVVNDVVEDVQSGTAQGVRIRLRSKLMGQELSVPLLQAPRESSIYQMFGLAEIHLLEKLLSLDKSFKEIPKTYRETQMIFANMPHDPVIHNTNEKNSGYVFFLEPVEKEGEKDLRLRAISPSGQERNFVLSQIAGKSFPGDDNNTVIHVVSAWKNLTMKEGKPTEGSSDLKNPAVLITLSGHLEQEKKMPVMQVARKNQDVVLYRVLRGQVLLKEGELKKGESLPLGWADWSAELEASYEKARMTTRTEEASQPLLPDQQTVPGLKLQLVDKQGVEGSEMWLSSGTSRLMQRGDQWVRVGFGLRTERVPFLISLEDFQVPMDAGTETPANFISHVRFHDPQSGEKLPARIEMNRPASYPDDWWRGWMGTTYKFSQAGWDPQNKNQTTLQVLHDPGWLCKWFGSLMICWGIFMMFYWKKTARSTIPTIFSRTETAQPTPAPLS
jgi:hypothetical protein